MNREIEHASLRQEIIESGTHAINAANIVVAVTGVALVAAFQFESSLIALLPLFPLYYSYKIAFNSTQTIARTSVYLRFVEKEQYEEYLSRLRQKTYRDDEERRRQRWWISRLVTPHSVLREEWISPILQSLFLWLGAFCLLVAAWFVVLKWDALQLAVSSGFSILPPGQTASSVLIVIISLILVVTAAVIWPAFAVRHVLRFRDPLYGSESMIGQFESAWMEVANDAGQKELQSN